MTRAPGGGAQLIGGPGGVVLDIGTGNGIVSYALVQDGGTVEPAPPRWSALAPSAETGAAIDVRQGSASRLPVGGWDARLVVARQLLHHSRPAGIRPQSRPRVGSR